ncbi:MAG: hypothetical protein ACRDN0_28180 [Trebonia sp.]
MTSMIKNRAGKIPGLLAVLALVPDPRKLDGQVKLGRRRRRPGLSPRQPGPGC